MRSSVPIIPTQPAERALRAWLQRHGKSWNDLPNLLHQAQEIIDREYRERHPNANPASDPRDQTAAETAAGTVTGEDPGHRFHPLDLIRRQLEYYVTMEPHEYVAATLWIAHTFIYERYLCSPRLAFISPVENSGKTTALDVISRLVPRPYMSAGPSPAVLYRLIEESHPTLLLDEFDDQPDKSVRELHKILRSGYRRGRLIKNQPKKFPTFGPLALAANRIDCMRPALQTRCLVINMTRRRDPNRRRLGQDMAEQMVFNYIYSRTFMWLREANLNPDPPLPAEVTRNDRYANNWRPLIALADACSAEWGEQARAAAIALRDEYRDENILVTLLRDIYDIFNGRHLRPPAVPQLVRSPHRHRGCAVERMPGCERQRLGPPHNPNDASRVPETVRHPSEDELASGRPAPARRVNPPGL
jgi:hypothetical protein